MLLWVLFVSLALGVTAAVVWPLLSKKLPQGTDHDEDRLIAVFRDRAAEIEREREAGRLTEAEARAATDALVEQMSGELGDQSPKAAPTQVKAAQTPRSLITAALVFIFVPALSFLVYQRLGAPDLVSEDGQWSQQLLDPARIEAMIGDLKARVGQAPNDGEAWALLAGAYKFTGDHPKAIEAFERAAQLLPPNARLLAEFAESIALTQDNRFAGRPVELLERALAADGNEPKAIALMGAAQYQLGNLPRARQYLGRLHAEMPADMPERQAIGEVLARIDRELATMPSAQTAPPKPAADAAQHGPARVSGTVSLHADLVAKTRMPFTLFVVARAEQGSRIPLAVLRIDNASLPLTFQLDERHTMDPSRSLASVDRFVVEARVSRSGNATREPGDLTSSSISVSAGAQDLNLVIDREVKP